MKVKETKEEAKTEEKKVTVEMSEAQKEKFVELMAKDKEEVKAPDEKTAIELRFWHRRNGMEYGPGRHVLPSSIASSLVVADQQALDARIRVNESNDHFVQILGRGVTKPVRVM